MPKVGRYSNPTINVDWYPEDLPSGVDVRPILLPTPDRASTTGVLYLPKGGARKLVAVMHPRVDCTRHYLIPGLLRAGYGVWAQRSRWVGNDLRLVHERVLVDIATAHDYLARHGYDDIWLLGNSGGASLYTLYAQQSAQDPALRLTDDSAGSPVDLTINMPVPQGLILLAPHPGQGDLLLTMIDPSVVDESDGSFAEPSLDMYDPSNGFAEPPASSSYAEDFLDRYRAAQRQRVERIDAKARASIKERRELRKRSRSTGDPTLRRKSLVPEFIVVYRTDADPRATDLSIDSSERTYGSILGVRPDIINYGPVGFARLTTPEAWLSTWSGIATRAAIRLTGPAVKIPSLIVGYTADNSVFPSDLESIMDRLGSIDKTYIPILGDHYGYEPGTEKRSGGGEALESMVAWLGQR